MPLRAICGLVLLALLGCTPSRPDLRHPASCSDDTARALPVMQDADLQAASSRAKFVVRARVVFTGTVTGADRTPNDYVVVAPVEFIRGEPGATTPRHREEFPLWMPAGSGPLASLKCREGDNFLFLLDLPAQGEQTAATPADIASTFGPEAVTVHAVIGPHERGRISP